MPVVVVHLSPYPFRGDAWLSFRIRWLWVTYVTTLLITPFQKWGSYEITKVNIFRAFRVFTCRHLCSVTFSQKTKRQTVSNLHTFEIMPLISVAEQQGPLQDMCGADPLTQHQHETKNLKGFLESWFLFRQKASYIQQRWHWYGQKKTKTFVLHVNVFKGGCIQNLTLRNWKTDKVPLLDFFKQH